MQKYISQNISIIIKISLVFAIGIVVGIIIYNCAGSEYINIIQNIFEQSKQESFEGINILANGMKNNIIYIVLLHISLICIFTPLIVFFLLILKSISIGIYICTLFSIFGISKGIVVVIIGAVIPNLISFAGYVLISTNILNIYNDMLKAAKFDISKIIKTIYIILISFSLLSFSLVVEQLTSSIIFNLYNNI